MALHLRRRGGALRRAAFDLALLMAAVAAGVLFAPRPAAAQFPWRTLTTPGYAAGGMAAAAVPAFSSSLETGVVIFGVGIVGGAVAGYLIGDAAEDRLARGEELSGGHRNAVRAGTVLAGAGVGALGSFLVINSEGESSVSDETIFASFVAGGAALGALTQVLLESRLRPAPESGAAGRGPQSGFGVGFDPAGRTAVVLRMEL